MVIRHLHPKHRAEIEGKTVPLSQFLWALRIFIISVLIAFALAGVGGYYIWHLANEVKQTQKDGHQDRINEDASLQQQIADAVCAFVDPIAPGTSLGVDRLRAKYQCPYIPATTKSSSEPQSSITPNKSSTSPTSSPSSTRSPLAIGPTVSAPSPTPTPTVTKTVTPSPSPTSDSPTAIISLPKLICLSNGVCI